MSISENVKSRVLTDSHRLHSGFQQIQKSRIPQKFIVYRRGVIQFCYFMRHYYNDLTHGITIYQLLEPDTYNLCVLK